MKKTDQDYLKLMVVINVYSRFNGEFENMYNGYDDETTSLETLESVEESFKRAEEIKDESFKMVANELVEEMKGMLEQLAEVGGEKWKNTYGE